MAAFDRQALLARRANSPGRPGHLPGGAGAVPLPRAFRRLGWIRPSFPYPPLAAKPEVAGPQAENKAIHFTELCLSPVGNSAGIAKVTAPVAAHSVPRFSVAWKPTHFMARTSLPIGVLKTRPLS